MTCLSVTRGQWIGTNEHDAMVSHTFRSCTLPRRFRHDPRLSVDECTDYTQGRSTPLGLRFGSTGRRKETLTTKVPRTVVPSRVEPLSPRTPSEKTFSPYRTGVLCQGPVTYIFDFPVRSKDSKIRRRTRKTEIDSPTPDT